MKKRITITKADEKLHFYLTTERGCVYLFTQIFSKGVYDYDALNVNCMNTSSGIKIRDWTKPLRRSQYIHSTCCVK